jgi:hypothetical protein
MLFGITLSIVKLPTNQPGFVSSHADWLWNSLLHTPDVKLVQMCEIDTDTRTRHISQISCCYAGEGLTAIWLCGALNLVSDYMLQQISCDSQMTQPCI